MSESIPNNISTLPEGQGQDPRLVQPVRITKQVWPKDVAPLVSICCTTYNHGKFVRECLDGFLMQETIFPVEVLIHDDASMDGTAGIIREYEAKYPYIIKPIYQTENQYSKGVRPFLTFNLPRAKGQYIAFCEGDDYWTDPLKLQKQVNFLEDNPAYVFCWTRFKTLDDKTNELLLDKNSCYFSNGLGADFDFEIFFKGWHIGTQTLVFKKNVLVENNNFNNKYYKDAFLISDLLTIGKGYCLDEVMAVYRLHGGGVYSSTNEIARAEIGALTYREIYKAYSDNNYLKLKYRKFSYSYVRCLIKNKLYKQSLFAVDELISLTSDPSKHKEDLFSHVEALLRKKDKQLRQINKQFNQLQNSWSFKVGRAITLPARGMLQLPIKINGLVYKFKLAPRKIRNKKELKDRGVVFIDKRKIIKDRKNLKPLSPSVKRTPKLIVSLTSFPQRMPETFFSLYSLLKQTVTPDLLVLWLAEEQFPNRERDLTKRILNLQKHGLIIKWCKDIKSYKKLIPALKEYPNDIIVTADDDIYYPENWLELLYNSYLREPQHIHCHRAHRITFNGGGEINYYVDWPKCISTKESSYLNFFTGCGGVLYPPGSLHKDVLNEELFTNLCPTADDIWFWAMAVLKNAKIRIVDNNFTNLIYVDPELECGMKDSITLYQINKDANDSQLKNVIKYYKDKKLDLVNHYLNKQIALKSNALTLDSHSNIDIWEAAKP